MNKSPPNLADRLWHLIDFTIQSRDTLLSFDNASHITYPARPYYDSNATNEASVMPHVQWYRAERTRRLQLQDCLTLLNRPDILRRLPLSADNRPALADYDLTVADFDAMLHREHSVLADLLRLDKGMHAAHEKNIEAEATQVLPTKVKWQRDNWRERLRKARANVDHTQKEAAFECCVSVETYKKWEQGRTPAVRNMQAVSGYITKSERSSNKSATI